MYCSKCGKEIKDDVVFCPYCGAPVNAKSQQTVQSHPRPDTSTQNRVIYNMPGANSASWVTDSFGGTLFLVISILMTCYLVMYLFSNFGMTRVILAVPRLFICIGCWMIYSSCHNYRPESTGFTLIQGGLIALIILYCIPAIVLFFRYCSEFEVGFVDEFFVLLILGIIFLVLFIIVQIVAFTVQCRTEDSPKNYNESVIHGRVSIIRDIGILLIIPVTGLMGIGASGTALSSLDNTYDLIIAIGYFIGAVISLNILLYFIWRAPLKVLHLCKSGDIGDSKENISYTSLSAIINLCYFLVLYIIQFFAIASLQGILSEILSLAERYLGDISFVSDGLYSLINNTAGQTISSLLLIVLLACIVALLFSIRTKSKSYEGQN